MGKHDELKGIELGKIWMKNSVNRGHDYEHAMNVEEHAIEIYGELKKIGVLPKDIDENLVKLAVWWHDSYKARIKGGSLYALFFEGREAAKITRKELGKYISKKQLELLIDAIKMHNNFIIYFLFTKNYPPLLQILLEADNIDAMSEVRFNRMYSPMDTGVLKLLFKINQYLLLFWLNLLPKSKYIEEKLNKLRKGLI